MPESLPKVCIVVGIPGVGKTTVLNLLKDLAAREGYRIKVVNFGDRVLEEARKVNLAEHRDQIRKLPLTVQFGLQSEAAKAIAREVKGSKGVDAFVVDTHSLVHTVTGYWPGLPSHVITEIKPLAIFVVEAKPEEIYSRRMRDSTVRVRGDEREIGEIEEFMLMARYTALASAVLVGASVYILKNYEGMAEEVAREILRVLKML